jgi:hypothetical protein
MLTRRRVAIMTATVALLAIVAPISSDALYGPGQTRRPLEVRATKPWTPAPETTWQWQLTTPVDQFVSAKVYDIDLFDNPTSVVASLHRRGHKVICYLDAGTFEDFRSDSGSFPKSALGKRNGWPGERWLDIRRVSLLAPIMRARFQQCEHKHFDGVEADNVDGYTNATGFPLTASDQLNYDKWLARTAHALGLSIALKNDLDQARQLEPYFDYALDEQCFQYSECSLLKPFVAAHKTVFEVEYNLSPGQFCRQSRIDGFMSMRKDLNLDAARDVCW